MLCLELCCFVCVIWPSQLSCLGSSVRRMLQDQVPPEGSSVASSLALCCVMSLVVWIFHACVGVLINTNWIQEPNLDFTQHRVKEQSKYTVTQARKYV